MHRYTTCFNLKMGIGKEVDLNSNELYNIFIM